MPQIRRHLPFIALILAITACSALLQWWMTEADRKPFETGGRPGGDFNLASSLSIVDLKLRDLSLEQSAAIRAAFELDRAHPDITVIGIDDQTLEAEGGTFGMKWALRKPYAEQLILMQKHFPPSVIAYDIIFKDVRGERERESNPDGVAIDPEKVAGLGKALGAAAESNEISDQHLIDLSTYIGEQGEMKFSAAMSELYDPATPDLKKIPILAAFSFTMRENMAVQGGGEYFRWSVADVLGDDPSDQREELGKSIPHLTKYAIPGSQVKGVGASFPWCADANLISQNLSNCQQAPINVPRDADGVVRRVPLIFGTKYFHPLEKVWKEVYVPSFSLTCVLRHLGLDSRAVHVDLQAGWLEIRRSAGPYIRVSVDPKGAMVLNFPGKSKSFTLLPFHKITSFGAWLNKNKGLEAELEASARESLRTVREALTGRICIVGLTHTGNGDTGPTPIEPHASYVFIHAAAIDNILGGRPAAPMSPGASLLLLFAFALYSAWSSRVLSVSRMAFTHLLLVVLILLASLACAFWNLPQMPILIPLLQVLVCLVALTGWRYLSEEREKIKIRKMFATMVSPEVLHHMEANPESFSLSGQRTEATMMFSDVAGFTTISEALGPDKLVDLLNKYLTPMTDIIMESGGYLDKYAGDGIMAEWGVPKPDPRHAIAACHACLDQQAKLSAMREDLYQQFGYRLVVRMGVNTGIVSAGNMGSSNHFSYTVMGDAVNLAARLEPTNKDYDTLIIIGQRTWELAKDEIESRFLDRIVVKGKTEAIPIHELIGRKGQISPEFRRVVELYEEGFKLHEERRWDEALACFRQALEIRPEDGPSKAMIERVEHYIEEPPPEKWQGEYVRKKKD
ncbi:MAG: hypothetical protein RL095_1468 [Verrucomicrobiota bacterium]|jgi:adenylate cyclase